MASTSSSFVSARARASRTAGTMARRCSREASSGTTPPYLPWVLICDATTDESTDSPFSTTAAAVSSQEDSMPRMRMLAAHQVDSTRIVGRRGRHLTIRQSAARSDHGLNARGGDLHRISDIAAVPDGGPAGAALHFHDLHTVQMPFGTYVLNRLARVDPHAHIQFGRCHVEHPVTNAARAVRLRGDRLDGLGGQVHQQALGDH